MTRRRYRWPRAPPRTAQAGFRGGVNLPAGNTVAQELWGLSLAYNLVRFEAERVAAEAGVPPTRISFVAMLNLIETALRMWGTESAGAWPKRLVHLREDIGHFVLPERRERSYPRAVKIKMSNYARKRPAKSSSRKRAK